MHDVRYLDHRILLAGYATLRHHRTTVDNLHVRAQT